MSRKTLPAALGLLIVLAVTLLFPRWSYNDPDTFWHIELGRYMAENHAVLHHAIHTFYNDQLPYVPHEYAFQIVLALLYQAFGWPGAYLLTAVCLLLLVLGMERLARVSRREAGLVEGAQPVLLLLVMLSASWIYYNYFTIRPQMVSAWMIVWFFVYLRQFQMRPRWKDAALMTALSLAIANFHAGVWLVVAVFTGMAALETLIAKRWTWRRATAFLSVLLAGFLNPGGWKSIMFIATVTKGSFNMLISEWQPISYSKPENVPILLLLMFFASILPFAMHGKPFRWMIMLGILFLGVSSYKMNLYMWLFMPYFAASLPDAFPKLNRLDFRFGRPLLASCLAIGLAINTAVIFAFPPRIDAKQYPVEEMNAILDRVSDGSRPDVMAPYGASGYVMFRGANILADGRQDPFVTDESKGALGWNAFQRSMYGYGEYLTDIVAADRPDYVIARSNVSAKLYKEWVKTYGEPVFKGKFGSVFAIGNDAKLAN